MWTMEDVLSELNEKGENGEKNKGKNNGMAPGFRFHPTDEELITFYLASKVFYNHNFTSTPFHIAEVDLNRCEPWDLPEGAKMGEKEWYIYSLRDRKYPTGLRTNRATGTGYWKATGKDRQIHSGGNGSATGVAGDGSSSSGMLIGMKKTLVFYQGRAPRGVKTRWVMHEYRLDGLFSSFRLSSKEEWVICRIFQKHGGEKKHFHPPPPPLSPFLRCLPPLLDVPTTSSSSSSTTQSLQNRNNNNNNNNNNNKPNHFPTYNDSNFLLQSLLSNPLPNFSSMTNDPTPTTTLFSPHSVVQPANPIASTTAGPTGIDHLLKQKRDMQQYQNNMDKICHATTNDPLFSMAGDVEDDVAVRFDMSSSVATLDRLLNPHQHHHVNFSTESWPFHQ